MKLDFDELAKGISDGLEKNAGVAQAIRPALVGGGLLAAGALGKNLLSEGANYVEKGMANLSPNLLPAALNRLGGVSSTMQPGNLRPIINVNLAKPKTLFDLPAGEFGSLSSPNTGKSFLDTFNKVGQLNKKSDIVTDALARAAQMRIANKVIDSVSSPDKATPQPAPEEAKKIEIVSKYPEMAEMLKQEENKAYLEKLLKEQP
jgi:hypothetical protein